VAGFERRDNTLEFGQLLECRQRLLVGGVGVLNAVRVAQPGVLGADGGVVQTGGDAVGKLDLPILVLQNKRARALQHAQSAALEPRGVFAVDNALAAGLNAGHRHRLVTKERIKQADRIRAAANAGDEVTFSATGTDNTTSVEWDFGRDIGGNGTRYSNLSSVTHTVHASGRYNVTFTAFYEEEDIAKELILIVNYEEEYQEDIIHNEALFFAIAGSELIMSAMLGYWTHQIRKEKVYL